MNIIKILYYDRIDVPEGIDVNKTSEICDICHYWYFSNKGFKFQPNVFNRCHDLLMMFMNMSINTLTILYLNIFFWAYNFIINKITRSLIMTK